MCSQDLDKMALMRSVVLVGILPLPSGGRHCVRGIVRISARAAGDVFRAVLRGARVKRRGLH